MLQRIARGSLKSHYILVNAGLRQNVLVEESVVRQATAQVVMVPGNFARDPRFTFGAEAQAF